MSIGNIAHKMAQAVPQCGDVDTLGNFIRMLDENGNICMLSGKTMPTDNLAGYGVGCIFIHTDGTAGTAKYTNEGSATSCDFDADNIA